MALKSLSFSFEGIEVHEREFAIAKAGETIQIEPKAFRLLLIFLQNPQKLFTKEELLDAVWGDVAVTENSLARGIAQLRRALGDDPRSPRFIETVSTIGYRFLCNVETRGTFSPVAASVPVEVHQERSARKYVPPIVSVIAAVLLITAGVTFWSSGPADIRVTHVAQITNDAKGKVPTNPVFTDGVHLYLAESTPQAGGGGIAQVSVSGGETTRLPSPLQEIDAIYAISPDYSELLVGNGIANSTYELWAQPLPAGTPHRIGNIVASDACYTPDGNQILYADGHSLSIVDRDGSNVRPLAKVEGPIRRIHYSPDGKRIRFDRVTLPFDTSVIWEIDANGQNLHPLLPNWGGGSSQCCGNWSPDGKYYFFEARQGTDQSIWFIREPRSVFLSRRAESPSRLISGPLRVSAPVPSTDGKRLFITAEELRVELQHYDTAHHRFDSFLNNMSVLSYDFSRDGKWVAYVTYPDWSLWRSRVDGTEKMQLTFPPVHVYAPRWSPDGSRIAFTNAQIDRPWNTGLVSSSGGPTQSFPGADPSWLPDGSSIILSTVKPSEDDTLEVARLNLQNGVVTPLPGSKKKFSPRVSPDGRYVAALTFPGTELDLLDLKTGRWSVLAKGEYFGYPLWSHDGKYIYMREVLNGSAKIVRVRVQDLKTEEVFTFGNFPQPAGRLVNWFGLTPNGDPVLVRDLSTQEVYALDLQ